MLFLMAGGPLRFVRTYRLAQQQCRQRRQAEPGAGEKRGRRAERVPQQAGRRAGEQQQQAKGQQFCVADGIRQPAE